MIGLIGFIELIAIAQMYATKKGYKVNTNQEFCALGIANVAGSFFAGYPIGGSFSRTAVNAAGGAETPLSGAVTGAVIFLALVVLSPTFYYIPMAGLAAIVVTAVIDLVKVDEFREAWRINKYDFAVMMSSFLFTLGLGVIPGIGIGAGLSLMIYLRQNAYPHVATLALVPGTNGIFKDTKKVPDADKELQSFDGISIIRIDSDVWFANCGYLKETISDYVRANESSTLIFDFSACNRIDLSGLHMMSCLVKEMQNAKVTVMFTETKEKLFKQLRVSKMLDSVLQEESTFFPHTFQALQAARHQGSSPVHREDLDITLPHERSITTTLAQARHARLMRASFSDPLGPSVENDPRNINRTYFHVKHSRSQPHNKADWQ